MTNLFISISSLFSCEKFPRRKVFPEKTLIPTLIFKKHLYPQITFESGIPATFYRRMRFHYCFTICSVSMDRGKCQYFKHKKASPRKTNMYFFYTLREQSERKSFCRFQEAIRKKHSPEMD